MGHPIWHSIGCNGDLGDWRKGPIKDKSIMKKKARAILVCLLLTPVIALSAADVWILRGFVTLPPCPAPSAVLLWNADAVLHNFSDHDETVRVVEVSNDGVGEGREVVVPAKAARGVQRTLGDFSPTSHVWITHLDVPDAILIDGRLEYLYNDCSLKPQPTDALGKWSSPIFRELVPAGKSTIHPGVDLGRQDTRLNVGIYNAGASVATATVEVFRTACPEQPPVSQVVSVPAKTLIQTSVFALPPRCVGFFTVSSWVAHAIVTVDQPSLSYAVALSNVAEPHVTVGFSM